MRQIVLHSTVNGADKIYRVTISAHRDPSRFFVMTESGRRRAGYDPSSQYALLRTCPCNTFTLLSESAASLKFNRIVRAKRAAGYVVVADDAMIRGSQNKYHLAFEAVAVQSGVHIVPVQPFPRPPDQNIAADAALANAGRLNPECETSGGPAKAYRTPAEIASRAAAGWRNVLFPVAF